MVVLEGCFGLLIHGVVGLPSGVARGGRSASRACCVKDTTQNLKSISAANRVVAFSVFRRQMFRIHIKGLEMRGMHRAVSLCARGLWLGGFGDDVGA